MTILNSGGTFNKRYNPINGEVEVAFDNLAVEAILSNFVEPINMAGVIYKDSLDMTKDDRAMLANIILQSTDKKFVIVHGTDTMDLTAMLLDGVNDDRVIVITGSMIPFSIDTLEATTNLSLAIGYARACEKKGVYICMNGLILPFNEIVKNKQLGVFERVQSKV
ncbi:MAG: asparaginase domain-containing protein [Campylobacterota bacterium]|nr:asparaginase domain-containing protein [Campylobacterota bacterium]